MKFFNFTFIKLCLCFITGILAGFYFSSEIQELFQLGALLLVLFLVAFFRERKQLFPDIFFGITVFVTFFYVGFLNASLHKPENYQLHFINSDISENKILQAKITEKLKPTLYNNRYILEAEGLKGAEKLKPLNGKILLSTEKDSATEFQVGEVLLLPARFNNINSPLNPFQFNYAHFMQKQGVLKQLNLDSKEILILKKQKSLPALADKYRENIILKLKKHNFSSEELGIIQALLLGQRRDISPKIYEEYAAAGAVHILAVSGLHVGIVLLILNLLLKPLERIKNGRVIKTFLLLFLLWGFALLAGLSPSVIRAVSMFSFVAIGMQLQRKTSVINSLFASLFILLLIDPYFIFQVGFQLSYLAVFAIVSLQPFLYKIYQPKWKPLKYMWGILSVSIAAQIGVVPLSLYYFHQFPGLFFLTNLVILPVLGIILGGGIVIILFAQIDLLPGILSELYGKIISLLNQFVAWISRQEDFVFSEISFSALECILAYFIILNFIFLVHSRKYKNLVLFLFAIIIFQLGQIHESQKNNTQEAIIFHKTRNTLLGLQQNKNLKIYHNLDSLSSAENILSDYKTGKNIHNIKKDSLKNVLNIFGKKLLLIDSTAIYDLEGLKPDLVLLINSTRLNLERLLQKHKPEIIIADGSNYHSSVARWETTCRKEKIPFHHTGKRGSYRIFQEP